jgi:hypothetical protein
MVEDLAWSLVRIDAVEVRPWSLPKWKPMYRNLYAC